MTTEGRDAGGVLCIRCGYDLTGLAPEGRCPECALAVADSRRGDLLRFADASWRRTVLRGADALHRGVRMAIASGVLIALTIVILAAVPFAGLLLVVAGVMMIVGVGDALLGQWSILTAEPKDPSALSPRVWRRLGRAGVLTTALLGASWPVVIVVARSTPLIAAWLWVGLAVGVAATTACVHVLADLARRRPDPPLQERLRRTAGHWVVMLVIAAGASTAGVVFGVGVLLRPGVFGGGTLEAWLPWTGGVGGLGPMAWGGPALAGVLKRFRASARAA